MVAPKLKYPDIFYFIFMALDSDRLIVPLASMEQQGLTTSARKFTSSVSSIIC